MAKVSLFISMTLDGYLADENGTVDFLSLLPSDEEDTSYDDFFKDVTSLVMGRVTYDQITTELSPGAYPYEQVDSFVMTSQSREDQQRIYFSNDSVTELVERNKLKYDGTLWVVGGSCLIQPLLESNLIDEFHIAVLPILLGDGKKLFQSFHGLVNLELVKTYSKNGIVYLIYRRK